ncbi:hypothetical protein CHARACLAT_003197 [Characodon lateralis]|uniref:Secreted protein n=1 Tax=Characodon lateralis TaxID=208331 RepID=A0ABU7CK19_9TELE|nr:hypothetical protein [Characodon lateralis]
MVLGAPFTLLTSLLSLYLPRPHLFSLSFSVTPPPLSLSLHLIFLNGKDSKTPFSNEDFFVSVCRLTSKPRTPTHAPPSVQWCVWGVFTHRQLRSHPLSS